MPSRKRANRRTFLVGASSATAAALLGCGKAPKSSSGENPGNAACTVYPEQTEGPFYLDGELVRSDIAEGKPGIPLKLTLEVVSAADCAPLPSAAVDVWHCDASGVYSGYPGQLGGLDTSGQKFMRGTQVSDATGRVVFQTIYPGWYPGRTTHIHFKVRGSGGWEATSQMYFPEDVSAAVYGAEQPYVARGQKDTSNAADGVATGTLPLVELVKTAGGYEATLRISVAAPVARASTKPDRHAT